MNEQVKKNIMEYKQKYLQKLTDAQVPEKLEKQLEEMDWTCLELIHRKKQQRGTFAPLQAAELSEIRDTAYDISARMARSLEQNKAPRHTEQER